MSNSKDKAAELGASLRDDMKEFRSELQGLAEEVRLKIHLGSMEVKDSWTKLEPKLHAFEASAERAGAGLGKELKHVGEEVKHAGQDLKRAGQGLKEELVRLRDRIRKA